MDTTQRATMTLNACRQDVVDNLANEWARAVSGPATATTPRDLSLQLDWIEALVWFGIIAASVEQALDETMGAGLVAGAAVLLAANDNR